MRLLVQDRDDFPHGPGRAPQQEQFALDLVNVADSRALRIGKDEILEILEAVAIILQYREAMIHDGIQKRIYQEARVIQAQARPLCLNALPDRVPHVSAIFLKSQDGLVAKENGYLFVLQLALVDLQHARDDEKTRLQFAFGTADGLDFGAFGNANEILDRQGMQLILGGQRMNHIHVREPVDVDPAHGRPLRTVMSQEVVQIVDVLNQNLILAVIDAADEDRRTSRWEASGFRHAPRREPHRACLCGNAAQTPYRRPVLS